MYKTQSLRVGQLCVSDANESVMKHVQFYASPYHPVTYN